MSVETRTQALQRAASDPARSAWVSANAGSGKTHVLTQRVVRLLLSGVAPARILCLTFTRAAAANMATRVFALLRDWTRLDDDQLARTLAETTGAAPDAAAMRRARTLFAHAVETPGGLKIQTIHAFCEALLHRFPFEANAPANFRVVEAMEQDELLRAAARDAFAAARGDAALAAAVETLTLTFGRRDFEKLMGEVAARREDFSALFEEFRSADAAIGALTEALGLAPGETVASLEGAVLGRAPARAKWAGLADRLAQGSTNDRKKAEKLRAAAALDDEETRREAYAALFFTTKGEIPKQHVTGGLADADPRLADFMTQECARLVALFERVARAGLLERSAATMRLAEAVLSAYAQRKAALGALDFADLVGRVAMLLERSSGQWVMYKLDQGLDHILLDEAQDTSPTQWAILRKLADEFFAGAGRPGRARSFFAVGDEKQSIYSFQGAAPRMFEDERRALERRFARMDRTNEFADIRLTVSFRSAPSILEAVDAVFADAQNRRGLGADDAPQPHQSWRAALAGRIEIWPLLGAAKTAAAPDAAWRRAPQQGAPSPVATLADRIARRIAAALAPGSAERVHERDGRSRPVRAGDVMILMRKRGPLFEATIRALKTRGVPVAGADRIRLADHLATRDLVAAGRALLSPADDLSLACALKSPLLGLTDDDLLALCPGRPGTLAQALAASAAPAHRAAAARLAAWRAAAASVPPFAFYADLLGPQGGRRAFLERLGPEAGDVLDEFLSLALEHETSGPPSLTLFLDAIESGDLDVKREGEAAEVVRVMTVHAAKGLEAKFVVLPDTTGAAFHTSQQARLQPLPRGAGRPPFLIALGRAGQDCEPATQVRQAARVAAEDEHRRLLYVALTRAEETLVLAGCHGKQAPAPDCWALAATAALTSRLAFVETPAPWDARETILTRRAGAPGAPAPREAASAAAESPLAEWLARPAAPEAAPARLAPSASAPRHAGAEGGQARRRGRRLHALIEALAALPPDRRAAAAAALPGAEAGLGALALGLIGDPRLAPLFGPGGRGEVALSGTLEDGTAVSARLDRLRVTPQEAVLAEFKSGGGDDAAAHLPQIALYKRLVAALWPDRPTRALLVFAASGRIVEA